MAKHEKNGSVMAVEKSKINLKMDFSVGDVIDVLVSEQEENIERAIANLKSDKKKAEEVLLKSNTKLEKYIDRFVKNKYTKQMDTIENTFKQLGLNAIVKYEVIDGKEAPGFLLRSSNRQLKNEPEKTEKLIISLVIFNKDFDRSTIESSVSFYLEADYDDKMKELNKQREEQIEKVKELRKEIRETEEKLEGTSRLIRKAKAAVTKKAIGKDIEELVTDFRKQYPQIELKTK